LANGFKLVTVFLADTHRCFVIFSL